MTPIMTKIFESLSTSSTPERNASPGVDHETPPVNSDLSAFLTEIEASSSRFAPIYVNTSEEARVNLVASTPFAGTSDRTVVPHPPARPLTDLPFREDLNRIRARNHRWDDMSYNRIRLARDKHGQEIIAGTTCLIIVSVLLVTNMIYGIANTGRRDKRSDAEVTADPSAVVVIQDSEDNTEGVSLPNQEETLAVKDGSQKIPFATNGPGDASRSKGKGKVDLVDKKAEKKRITAKAKADLEVGRIPTLRIGGTCEVIPSEAPVAQSLGVIPPASLPVNFDSAAIPPCPAIQTAVNVSQTPPPRAPSLTLLPRLASELSSESSLSKRRRTTEVSGQRSFGPLGNSSVRVPPRHDNRWSFSYTDDELPLVSSDIKIINSGSCIIGAYKAVVAEKEEQIKSVLACTDVDVTQKELDRQKARVDSWEVSANANRQSADDYAAQVEVLKGEKQRLEDEVKKRDAHVEAASAEIARLRGNLEKSHFPEDRLRKERDEARRRGDEIASGSSARGARHSSRLERIRSYLIALHAQEEVKAQLCYRRRARISLEKMVEAKYELPPGLLENYVKEEEQYLAKVESFDPLGDDTLFPTPPSPPANLPRDAASQVLDGIIEYGSFLSPPR
ncbi:hypothetical protein AALP_AAs60744U000200 [Arabis alpina]|uniref:Uncharacterized protein n=1 Tax=Arabis alpina TaxID=50452 RepID=A0A087G0J3_ARAAL|nr:hypothetical protein AALP_AAs60744U000200 [Arabis alpina]